MNPPSFLLVAGESAGDAYGADVALALMGRFPGCRLFGLGGEKMGKAGVELEGHIRLSAASGLLAALGQIGALFRVFRRLVDRIETSPPDAAILIDFPDFNLRLAKRIKAANIPIIYYIGPQVWAWRESRVRQIKELVTRMLVIYPFEERIYEDAGVDVEFVGHPLIEKVRSTKTKEEFCRLHNLDPRKPVVTLHPGNHRKEIRHVLPTLCAATQRILALKAYTQFVLPVENNLERRLIERIVGNHAIRIVDNDTYDALRFAQAAIVTSGTATLEAALLGTPQVIVYRVSSIEAWFLNRFSTKVRLYGLVNVILGEDVVPELFQDRFTPELASEAAMKLMDDVWLQSKIRGNYETLRRELRGGNVAERVAGAVVRVINIKVQERSL